MNSTTHERPSARGADVLYDKGGEAALVEISRRKPVLKNRVAPEIKQPVVEAPPHAAHSTAEIE